MAKKNLLVSKNAEILIKSLSLITKLYRMVERGERCLSGKVPVVINLSRQKKKTRGNEK